MTGKTLRILIVEDVEDHALLIMRELQKAGFVLTYQWIETLQALEAALDAEPWDAIISDYSLPGFNALDTLGMVRTKGLDIPVFVVSGVIGEESAVDAMRAGAKDFILKGKYSRLAPAIEREIRETAVRQERRAAAEELVQAHEELKRQRAELERQHLELLETYLRLEEQTAERLQVVEELRQKEQMMVQQGRMAAIGEMLNNIAHHWRQPLNVLALNLQDLATEYELGNFTREVLDDRLAQAMAIIQGLSKVVDEFRDLTAVDKEKRVFDVEQVVAKTVALVRESFTERGITVSVEVRGEPKIDGYAQEFRQVLLNILMNAKDAFAEQERREARIKIQARVEQGRTVVTIGDNAGGIKAEIIEKIFEAFYTTKELGKGSGLGLFLARNSIEKNMGGRLTVRNAEDGAEFRIEL